MAVKEDLHRKFLDILGEWGKEFSEEMVEELKRKQVTGSNGSASQLAGSIALFQVKGSSLVFTMSDYWEFVEYGSRPSKFKGNKHSLKKIESIMQWIQWKGIKVTLSDKVKEKSLKGLKGAERKSMNNTMYEKAYRSLAYAIATNIAKKGTIKRFNYKGSNFVQDALKKKGQILQDRLLNELGLEIELVLTERLVK